MSKQAFDTYITRTVVPTTGIVTRETRTRPTTGETATDRHNRLAYQGGKKVNDARVKYLGGNTFNVQSQRKDENGDALEDYNVVWTGGCWLCQCRFGIVHPGVECTHTARIVEYVKRNKLAFGAETVAEMKSESERITAAWIDRSKAARTGRREIAQEEI